MKKRRKVEVKKTINKTKKTDDNMFKNNKQSQIDKEKTEDSAKKAAANEQEKNEQNQKEKEENIAENLNTADSQTQENQAKETGEISKEEELTAKLAESNDKYVRLAAEFDNYRRRVAKEKLDLISTASEDVIKGLLPVLDDCQRALQVLESSTDTEAAKAAKEGTELILNKMMAYLKSKGLSVIEALGKELDTDFHEAVAQFPVEEKEKKNKIIDIVQQGYTLNGKVIRFAKVVVGI